MSTLAGITLVLAAVLCYGLIALGFGWLFGSAAKLGGPEEVNPNQTEE